jgi:coenzyme F420-reducing hydrogenase gamma subunit
MGAVATRPRVGVVKLTSCDGCQLAILDLEDELLAITERFAFVDFPEATSNRWSGPFDVLFVEGSVSAPDQVERLHELRARTAQLVVIGACATAGGIQALRNWRDHGSVHRAVYAMPEYVDSLATATPISDHVAVDAELRGCPIDPGQLLELLTALAVGRRPQLPDQAVCVECKRAGTVCVLVARDLPCLGPVTRAGCGAICPAFDRGCYGCFGPREAANLPSLTGWFHDDGRSDAGSAALFSGFTAYAEPFGSAIDRLGGPPPADEASTGTREASDARD